MPFNINDQVQQKAFKSETARLWNISQSFDSFEFHTIEDVLQELEECQNTVDKDIAELKKEVKQLNLEVDGHKVEIDVINSKIDEDEANLLSLNQTLQEQAKELTSANYAIGNNTILIKNNQDDISRLHLAPVGSIIGWTPRVGGTGPVVALPEGWIRCDGGVIPGYSVWAGLRTPDLNSQSRFLRGGSDNIVLSQEDHMLQDHEHEDPGHTHYDQGHSHGVGQVGQSGGGKGDENGGPHFLSYSYVSTESAKAVLTSSRSNMGHPSSGSHGGETRPINTRVVWIMRVF